MKKVLFSIIIPTLNEENFLPRLLDSLTRQSQTNFEVIVVDGSSKDKTVELAKSFLNKLPKLNVIVSPKAGLPLQRNLGAKNAQGRYFVFADSDGVFLPYFIERISDYVEKNHPKLFTSWFRPDSEVPGDALITLLGNISIEMSIMIKRPHAPGPLTIVSKSMHESIGGYDESVKYLEDYDYSYRLHKQQGVVLQILRETLCVWSLRRLRDKGTLKYAQTYAKSAMSVLLNKPLRNLPGYIMGGQAYEKKKMSKPVMKNLEEKLKKLLKEYF